MVIAMGNTISKEKVFKFKFSTTYHIPCTPPSDRPVKAGVSITFLKVYSKTIRRFLRGAEEHVSATAMHRAQKKLNCFQIEQASSDPLSSFHHHRIIPSVHIFVLFLFCIFSMTISNISCNDSSSHIN